jgi:hypothetical protein
MTDAPLPSPESAVACDDPGDETANRFRFQWTWAAIMCCSLLEDGLDIDEVFCEHHEDVLVKHRDGSFTGHQVKTRAIDQPVWRSSDEQVRNSCVGFAKLERDFPGRFRKFCFLTNHPFYSESNSRNVRHVLQSIEDATAIHDLSVPIQTWLKRIASAGGVSEEITFRAMSKTSASADLPKLRDALMRLINTICRCWTPASECSHASVVRAANSLIEECSRASSLSHEQLLPAYLITQADHNEQIVARIQGKRMTFARVSNVLEVGRDSLAILDGDPTFHVVPGAGSTDLLRIKLDTGGFSAVTRNSAEDLRDKADFLGIKWTQQLGKSNGLARYNHILSLVWSDASRAFDASKTELDGFGPAMRESFRQLVRDRRRSGGDQLFDCTDDHLEGFAFSLTSQCKIVWSNIRPWEVVDGSG